jgi:hypothetical protein
MSDPIERIPSMRKPTRQGVPKRKPHDMARPMAESGKTKDAPSIAPRPAGAPQPASPEPGIPVDPTLALEMELAATPVLEPVSPPVPVVEPEPEQEPEPAPEMAAMPDPVPEPEPEPPLEPEPEPVADSETWVASAESVPETDELRVEPPAQPRMTLRQLLARVDEAFADFRAAAYRYPAEHMTDRLTEDGWTRKQMLAHISAWHELTSDRLTKMVLTGKPVPLDREVDSVNAGAARIAVGKSVGEVLKDTEMTMGRLRRQILRMTDEQIHAEDDWAINMIASNTYGHYVDHMADLVPPEPLPGTAARR